MKNLSIGYNHCRVYVATIERAAKYDYKNVLLYFLLSVVFKKLPKISLLARKASRQCRQ